MRPYLAFVGFLAACGPDATPFGIALELKRTPGQMCQSDACDNIAMTCDAAVSVKITPEQEGSLPWVSDCFMVPAMGSLCELNTISLPMNEVPSGTVRIEIAVWPYGPDTASCPDVNWDLGGNIDPTTNDPERPPPSIGGWSYFEVGSSNVAVVELGCLDEADLAAEACTAIEGVKVEAGVSDFDTNLSVSPTVQNLIVNVGEPVFDGSVWSMPTPDTIELGRTVIAGEPIWQSTPENPVDLEFQMAACIQVFEEGVGPVTATVSCRPATPDDTELELRGVLVRKATVDLVQEALGGSFPTGGLVLGRVLDHTGQPASGATIQPSQGTVQYLSDDMASIVGGGVTTTSGAFVSMDAPFDTTWDARLDTAEEVEVQLGGRITGKVTVIELQLTEPVIDP